jgi:hypothetical protein
MISIKNFTKCVFTISVLLVLGSPIYVQAQKGIDSQGKRETSNKGKDIIVGKDGQAFKTNKNGQCSLVIPDWLFERVKKDTKKYSLKITVMNIPQPFLETKQNSSDDQKFVCNITEGTKSR